MTENGNLKDLYESLRLTDGAPPRFPRAGTPPLSGDISGRAAAEALGEGRCALVPDWIVRFIASVAADVRHSRILDPVAGVGSLIAPLAARLNPVRAVALCGSDGERELAHTLNPDAAVDWQTGPSLPEGPFDCIVACLPADEPGALFPGTTVWRLLASYTPLLAPEGRVYALIACDPGMPGCGRELEKGFVEAGLSAATVLGCAGGVLAIAGREASDGIFVARLIPDQGHLDILRKNIALRRRGKVPELGVLEIPGSFSSVAETLLLADIGWLAADAGLSPVPMGTIAVQIDDDSATVPDEGAANILFVSPRLTASPSRPDPSAGTGVRVVLNPEQVSAAYLARHFTTRLGKRERELARVRARAKGLAEALTTTPVCIPPRPVQNTVLAVQASLSHMAGRIAGLERELWEHPFAGDGIRGRVESLSPDATIEAWIESLPFPLASILWAYRAEQDTSARADHLFHFFEALAEFHAIIMASALAPLCVGRESGLLDDDPYFRDSYRYATFRAWIVLARRLARSTRSLLGNPARRDECVRLYRGADRRFLAMLTSRRLFAVLDRVADERNAWKAHGGILGPDEAENLLAELEASLADVRRTIGTLYAEGMLLAPGTGEYHEGIFSYEADALAGSQLVFREVRVETTVPMDTARLYVLFAGRMAPLELLPLVMLAESPCSTIRSFYFYNRLEKEGVRWVCYHPGGDAELVTEDGRVAETLRALGLMPGSPEESP